MLDLWSFFCLLVIALVAIWIVPAIIFHCTCDVLEGVVWTKKGDMHIAQRDKCVGVGETKLAAYCRLRKMELYGTK